MYYPWANQNNAEMTDCSIMQIIQILKVNQTSFDSIGDFSSDKSNGFAKQFSIQIHGQSLWVQTGHNHNQELTYVVCHTVP